MKFTSTQENLSKGLNIINHIATKNSTLPILNNVNIQTDDTGIKLSTTNLEMGIHCWVRGSIEEKGEFTVNAKLLSDYVSLLPKENISIELKDNELEIQSGKDKTKIKGEPSENFPIIPTIEQKGGVFVQSDDLKKAINSVIFAAANNKIRPELNGVLLSVGKNTLTFAATDSYRLAECTIPSSKNEASENFSAIIPTQTLQEALRIVGDEEESQSVQIHVSDNQILFVTPTVQLISRLISGSYPDYKQIIPEKSETSIELSRNELIKVIKRAALFSPFENSDVSLEIHAGKKQIELRATNAPVGENVSTIELKNAEGGDNSIVFNHRYLLAGLNALSGDEAQLRLVDKNTPGVIKKKGDDDYIYIIMPIKA